MMKALYHTPETECTPWPLGYVLCQTSGGLDGLVEEDSGIDNWSD